MESSNLHCTTTTTNYDSLAAWHMRGAYCDWQRIDFPASFRFPVGTNFIDGVTLMAYGELKSNLHCSTSTSDFDFSLPTLVSLEHGVSSVSHGLTASNSYLFAWHDCCVERCATNRVDASVELFDSGAITATVTPLSTNQPPITIYQPPIPPEGFVGIGQDLAWATNAFPFAADAITNRGYSAWLDDYIGYNEPNGRYQVKVTVSALPEHGPCYLYCGPYRVNVAAPGTYCFPLEVFEEYRAYTLPERVPLSFEYDDGYDVEADAPVMAGAPLMAPRSVPDYYIVCRVPDVVVVPSRIPLNQAVGSRISILCNVPDAVWSYYSTVSTNFRLSFTFPSEAEIQTALVSELVVIRMRRNGHECAGIFYIDPAEPWPSVITNGWDFGEGTNTVNDAASTNETSSADSP